MTFSLCPLSMGTISPHLLIIVLIVLLSSNHSYANEDSNQITSEVGTLLEQIEKLKSENPVKAIELSKKTLPLIQGTDQQSQMLKADILNLLAYASLVNGDYEKSLLTSDESNKLSQSIGYQIGSVRAIRNVGHSFFLAGNYEKALEHYLVSLQIGRETGNRNEIANTLNSIAQTYAHQEQYDEAISVYNDSLSIFEELKDYQHASYALSGLAFAFKEKENFELALTKAEESLELSKTVNDKLGIAISYNIIGEVLIELNDTLEAEKYFRLSLKTAKLNNTLTMLTFSYFDLSAIEFSRKNYSDAIEYAKSAVQTAEEQGQFLELSKAHLLLSEIYEAQGQLNLSLQHFKTHKNIESDIFNDKSDKNLTALRISFEIDNLSRKNYALIQENKLNQAEFEKGINQRNFFVVFIILLLVIISFIYYRKIQRKKLQQERLLNNQLKKLNEIKDQFLTNTSHEFRTPLNGIIGLAECLEQELMGSQTPEAKQNLIIISKSGKRLASLVDDIMDFAQLKNGQIKLYTSNIDLFSVINEVIVTCQPLLADRSITLINDINKGEDFVKADEKRLSQIFFNLIGNAIKYSQQGQIKIYRSHHENHIEIHVSDEGIGIPEDKIETVFEYFEQVNGSATRTYQGSGLGLAIVKSLVELHGGTINVSSIEGEGSIVSFTLPTEGMEVKAPILDPIDEKITEKKGV